MIDRMRQDQRLVSPGTLLVAHPSLQDTNFRRSVILMLADSEEQGSMGVVLNHKTGSTLGAADLEMLQAPLAQVPVYTGGPVAQHQLLLLAWRWEPDAGIFQLMIGIEAAKAAELLAEANGFQVRAYMGYAGWEQGQLQSELQAGAWLPTQLSPEVEALDADPLWRFLMASKGPRLQLASYAPDNPALN